MKTAGFTDTYVDTEKEFVFSACSAHGMVMGWDDPVLRSNQNVMLADEYECHLVHEA